MVDVHMKYPVISTKQLMPVFPHIPNKNKNIDLSDKGFSYIKSINLELTT